MKSALGLVALLLALPAAAQDLLPIPRGSAVVTIKAGSQPHVVLILDIRDPECDPTARFAEDWPCPRDGNALPNPTMLASDEWTVSNLGEVFGITLDDAPNPNIYVAASRAYRGAPLASGIVHRLDGTTGAISVFAVLPNVSQAGLGNITFDALNQQFFVTNMEDGRIYRLGLDGAVLSTFDPFIPDDGTPGFTPLGDRAWGVAVFESRLYFGTWTEDMTRRLGVPNGVYSVGIDECGEFDGTEQLEITLTNIPGRSYTQPVADIAFSRDGRMLVAERTMESDFSTDAHNARVLEYERIVDTWMPSPRSFQVGGGIDSGGGVDYAECVPTDDCALAEPRVIATGDRLVGNGNNAVHGLQVFSMDGGAPANSYVIDFAPEKRGIGCVEYVRHDPCRIPPGQCSVTVTVSQVPGECLVSPVLLDASGSSAVRCCGVIETRFEDPTGAAARDWSDDPTHEAFLDGDWTVLARCSVTPECEDAMITSVVRDPGLPSAPAIQLHEEPVPDCTRPISTLSLVPGTGGPCSAPSYQWYEDGLPIPGATSDTHVIPPSVPEGDHEYHVVVSCPEPLACGDTSAPLTVNLRDGVGGPALSLEETPPAGCERTSRILRVVAGSFGSCSAPTFTWHEDGAPIAGVSGTWHEIPDTTPAGPHEYFVVVSCPETLPCGDTTNVLSIMLEEAPVPPAIALDESPPAGCSQPTRVLTVVAASVLSCSAPSFQWLEDGLPIPGATSDAYEVPASTPQGLHRYAVLVSCPEPLPCGELSQTINILVEPLPGPPEVSLEQRPSGACTRDVIVLRAVTGSFGDCSLPSYQWLEDGLPIPGATSSSHVVPDTTPTGWHEYVLVVSCPEGLPCGDSSEAIGVLVEDPPPGPQIQADIVPATDCEQAIITLSVVPGSFGPCTAPTYTWLIDGVPVAGATSDTFVVPATTPPGNHEIFYAISCPEPLPCGDESPLVRVVVEVPVSAVDGLGIDGLLHVSKVASSDLRLRWTDGRLAATHHHVVEGEIGLWYTHSRKECSIERVPPDAAGSATMLSPRPDNAYYLVAPADCLGEGRVGADSFGLARPLTGIGPSCGPTP